MPANYDEPLDEVKYPPVEFKPAVASNSTWRIEYPFADIAAGLVEVLSLLNCFSMICIFSLLKMSVVILIHFISATYSTS